ncbi:MAG: hypothetical protein IPG72_05075 [Ardenticatenales bacterium]|nr:hypothetical protein [Ardenticatenales bacterium]
MIDPHSLARAPIARRPSRSTLAPVAKVLSVAVVVAIAVAAARPFGAAMAQAGVLDRVSWQALPGDRALGGHGAVIDGRAMTLIGGEQGDFQPPDAMRSLSFALPQAWTTLAESGDRPVPGLSGRGLVGARAVRISDDGAAATSTLLICHCTGATTYNAAWPAAGGAVTWRSLADVQSLPLANGLMAFDGPRRRVIAAGGEFSGSGDIMTATWALDVNDLNTAQWQPLPAVPFQLIFQAADRDPRSGHFVAFGGQGSDATPTAHLWRADLAALDAPGAWSDVAAQAGAGPSARSGATLTFAGSTGWAILYGGYSPALGEMADAWALDYRDPSAPRWQSITPAGTPPNARSGQSAVWDAAGERVLVYGGLRLEGNGVRYLSDGFAIDLTPDTAPTVTTPAPTATTPVPTTPSSTPVPSPTTPSTAGGRIFLPLSLRSADVRAAP